MQADHRLAEENGIGHCGHGLVSAEERTTREPGSLGGSRGDRDTPYTTDAAFRRDVAEGIDGLLNLG